VRGVRGRAQEPPACACKQRLLQLKPAYVSSAYLGTRLRDAAAEREEGGRTWLIVERRHHQHVVTRLKHLPSPPCTPPRELRIQIPRRRDAGRSGGRVDTRHVRTPLGVWPMEVGCGESLLRGGRRR
jgi:hypothetical protein